MGCLSSIRRTREANVFRLLAVVLVVFCVSSTTSCSAFRRKDPTSDEEAFTKAHRYFERGKNTQAAEYFNLLLERFPRSRYRTRTQILLAEAYFRDKLYEEAKFLFSNFIQLHPAHDDAEMAYFRLGDCDFEQIRSKDRDQSFTVQALHAYERAASLFPRNPRRDEAQERIRFCKKRLAEHEYAVGRFYLKTKRYRSAAERFQFIVDQYPQGELADDALFFLGEAHRKQQQDEYATEAWNRLVSEYPESNYRSKAERQLQQITVEN